MPPPPAMFVQQQQQQQQHSSNTSATAATFCSVLLFFSFFFIYFFSVFSNLKISAPTAAPNSIRKMQQKHRRSFAAGWPCVSVCVRVWSSVREYLCEQPQSEAKRESRSVLGASGRSVCARDKQTASSLSIKYRKQLL